MYGLKLNSHRLTALTQAHFRVLGDKDAAAIQFAGNVSATSPAVATCIQPCGQLFIQPTNRDCRYQGYTTRRIPFHTRVKSFRTSAIGRGCPPPVMGWKVSPSNEHMFKVGHSGTPTSSRTLAGTLRILCTVNEEAEMMRGMAKEVTSVGSVAGHQRQCETMHGARRDVLAGFGNHGITCASKL